MKTALRNLVVTAAVAAAVPAFARACDDDHGVPAPAPAGWGEGRGWHDRDHRWEDRDGREWRGRYERRWAFREQERARLRAEYVRLDQARADFYSVPWRRDPYRAERFERWYASRRADLDREWNALSWYAAR
ncbi:hypothetical protein [Anaeromyxobacter oryzisoli]|uniref:hypothetical protein n=1 Tax=Anaeromyxobacter oryzisoli TaxID=2925408 RepID=UPI001F595DEF|nr:hypothetical protein [Anaeromyxobacter sp. SG63]